MHHLIVGKPNFSDQFKKIINRYLKVGIGILSQVLYLIVSIPDLCTLTYFGYNLDVMWQSAYLVLK